LIVVGAIVGFLAMLLPSCSQAPDSVDPHVLACAANAKVERLLSIAGLPGLSQNSSNPHESYFTPKVDESGVLPRTTTAQDTAISVTFYGPTDGNGVGTSVAYADVILGVRSAQSQQDAFDAIHSAVVAAGLHPSVEPAKQRGEIWVPPLMRVDEGEISYVYSVAVDEDSGGTIILADVGASKDVSTSGRGFDGSRSVDTPWPLATLVCSQRSH